MRLLQKIYEKVNGTWTIVSLVIFGLFMAFVLPYFAGLTSQYGDGFDTMFSFDLSSYYSVRTNYGEVGRRLYIILRWTFDVVWPIVYTFFYVMCIGYFGKKAQDKIGYRFLLVPAVAVLFDFLENTFATIFMASYPDSARVALTALIVSSMIKWLFVGLSFVVIVYVMIKWVVKTVGKNQE